MNRTCFARSLRSAIARLFVTAALLVSLTCPAVHAQVVFSTATTLKLSQPGTVAVGTTETLTATPTFLLGSSSSPIFLGSVTFYDGKKVLGTGQMIKIANSPAGPRFSAVLRTRLSIGAHSLTATYSGPAGFSKSTSPAQVLTVTGTYPLSLGLTASGPSPYTFTATATTSGTRTGLLGPVDFSDASDATLEIGTATLATPVVQAGLALTNSSPALYDNQQLAVATGDFNGDGIPDLAAVASQSTPFIAVLLGNGDGTFQAPSYVDVGTPLLNIAVADFNGDGIPDLVATGQGDQSVTVLLGNGDGTFDSQSVPLSGGTIWGVAVGDFNRDGYADIAVADYESNTVKLLLGNGDGTFKQSSYDVITGSNPDAIAVGDLNSDGILDLVIADYGDGTAVELLGVGDGTFGGIELTVGQAPEGVVVGDFNGDGKPDIATANSRGPGLTVLLQQTGGAFVASGSYPSLPATSALAIGDFNSDGTPDLAMASDTPGYIYLLSGNGNGSFQQTPISINVGADSSGLAVADFNGDGIADLASGTIDGSVDLLDGYLTTSTTASIKAAVPGTGTHSVVALYSGSANFLPAISNSVMVSAAVKTTTLTLTAPTTAQPGQTFTLTAQLTPFAVSTSNDEALSTDGETITFLSGTTVLGTGTLAGGVASRNVSLPAGSATITAKFAGDSIFAASSSNAAGVNVGSPTEALSSLKGQYAFLIHAVQPYTANTPIYEAFAGSFTADGAGNITAGVEDINTGTGASLALTFTGTYTLAANGIGTATITNNNGQSLTVGLTISGMQTDGTASAANLLLLGGTLNGAGVLLQQNPAEFALSDTQGSYAFALTGETCYAACTTKTTNTGSVSANWRMLLNGSTNLSATASEQVGATPYQSLALSGTATAPGSMNGRMTLSMNAITTPVDHPTAYVVYVVDSVHLLLLSTSSHSTTMLLSGEGQYQ